MYIFLYVAMCLARYRLHACNNRRSLFLAICRQRQREFCSLCDSFTTFNKPVFSQKYDLSRDVPDLYGGIGSLRMYPVPVGYPAAFHCPVTKSIKLIILLIAHWLTPLLRPGFEPGHRQLKHETCDSTHAQPSRCPSQTSSVPKLLSALSDGVVDSTQLSMCLAVLASVCGKFQSDSRFNYFAIVQFWPGSENAYLSVCHCHLCRCVWGEVNQCIPFHAASNAWDADICYRCSRCLSVCLSLTRAQIVGGMCGVVLTWCAWDVEPF